MILLTERLDTGYSDGPEFTNRGVFSSIDKAIEAVEREYEGRVIEHFIDTPRLGRFKVSKTGLGSSFDAYYDYEMIEMDSYMD